MLRRMLNHSQWAAAAAGARKDDGRGGTARDGMISFAASRIGLTLTISLVVFSVLLLGTTVSADDALERPGRPGDLTVAANAETLAYTATWAAVDGATHYKIRWRMQGAGFLPADEKSVETNRATFNFSEPGQWIVLLQGCNAVGCGPGIARTVTITPSRPANLAVSSTPGVLNLSATWEAAAGVTSYKLRWRRLDGGFLSGNQVVAATTSAGFSVSDYGWWVVRVEGCNASGCGRGVNVVTAVIPASPANLTVSSTPGVLELSATWDAAAGASSYRLRWRRPDGAFLAGNQTVVTTTSGTFSVSGYGQWVVWIEGCQDTDCGPSITQGVTIPPARPTNLAVSPSPGIYKLRATWDAAAGASSYRLRWRQPGETFAAGNETVTTATEASLTVSGAGRWVIRVQGCSDDGCGLGAVVTLAVAGPSPAVWLPVCDRTPQVRDALVFIVDKSCDKITAADMRWILYLSIWDKGATSLKTGDFSGLPKLGSLNLEGNALTALPEDLFDRLSTLQILYLSGNDLTALPEDLFNGLTALRKLFLDDNALTALPEDLLDGLGALTYLYLEGNALTALPEDLLDGLGALYQVHLEDNALTALPEDLFDGLDDLSYLYMADNALTALPEDLFDGLAELRSLSLNGNALTALPEEVFDGLTELDFLYIRGNDLTTLPEDVFDGLAGLLSLFLADNALTALPEDVFDGMASLNGLKLDGNDLTALPEDVFDGLTRLLSLNLSGNALTALPEDVFAGLGGSWSVFGSLDLGDNALTALPADVFDGLTRLRLLYLDDNELSSLPEDVFDDLTNLETLVLSGNPGAPFNVDLGSDVDVTQ